ncbi:MAG TPA: hypothetical protein PKE12_02090 [Kiritimatiellia bacterium]|nr:hypothetical protein [Kiritimatiellia bacterium]
MADNAAPASLDIGFAIAELKQATETIDRTEVPLEQVDRIRRWENLVATSSSIRDTVRAAVANADNAIVRYRDLAAKHQADPAKGEVLAKRVETMKEQADRLILSDAELTKLISGLSARLAKLLADPEVQQALQVRELLERTDAAIQKAASAVPDSLKP